MKIAFILLFIVGLTINLAAQSLDNLDQNNGFKEIKLGTPLSAFKGQIIPFGNSEDSSYWYTGSCCKMVFDNDVQKIGLRFRKGRLDEIAIQLVPISHDHYQKIFDLFDNFKGLYGSPTGFKDNMSDKMGTTEPGSYSKEWLGKKVFLSVTWTTGKEYEEGDTVLILVLNAKNLDKGF